MREIHSSQLLSMQPPPVEYLIDGLMPAGGVLDISGPPGEGKSTIVLSAVASISAGQSWFGLRCTQTPVAWVTGEASGGAAICRDLHRMKISSEADILFCFPGDLFYWDQSGWCGTSDLEDLIRSIRQKRIGLVVLDTIGSLTRGLREIDNDQQRQLARFLRATFNGTTTITISHTNQAAALADLSWRLHYLSRAGGNGFPGALRWAAGVAALNEKDDAFDPMRRIIAFGVSKSNEMPRAVWTNHHPALFEVRDDGQLVLVKDGREREQKPDLKVIQGKVIQGKEQRGRHEA